jgi:hypothetical protein
VTISRLELIVGGRRGGGGEQVLCSRCRSLVNGAATRNSARARGAVAPRAVPSTAADEGGGGGGVLKRFARGSQTPGCFTPYYYSTTTTTSKSMAKLKDDNPESDNSDNTWLCPYFFKESTQALKHN